MLRITRQSDYGIVLMTHLAAGRGRSADAPVLNARDLAGATNLPLPTVSKILKGLARGGLLVSHRGVKGGYSLARPPREISVEEIIRALEGPIAITECPAPTNWHRIPEAVPDPLPDIRLSEMSTGVTLRPRAAAAGRPGKSAS